MGFVMLPVRFSFFYFNGIGDHAEVEYFEIQAVLEL